MKILLLTKPDHGEYLSDMVLHGFRSIGIEIIDYPRLWYMYYDDINRPGYNPIGKVSGNGFTVFGTLPSDNYVDRSDIESKIVNRYFDYIIFARADFTYDLESLVLDNYDRKKIIWLDGHDVQNIFSNRLGKGIYFKRELTNTLQGVHPISFAIPEEKILMYDEVKEKNISDIVPGQTTLGTYRFITEESYYKEYAKSYFAVTMKKSGWDCMRHYEIIANGCVPIFLDITNCPDNTMKTLPKKKLLEILDISKIKNGIPNLIENNKDLYQEYRHYFVDNLKSYNTTKELVKYILTISTEYK